jgi:hypothetical protein
MLLGGHKKGTVFYYELLIGKGLEWVYVWSWEGKKSSTILLHNFCMAS